MNEEVLQEKVRIASARGELAGELAYPAASDPVAAALIVNPHPYMGGHMSNNVVTAIAHGLAASGLATLRFDYAGVGESHGEAVDLVTGMADFWATGHSPMDPAINRDVEWAGRWLRANLPSPVVLVGYSFGAQATQSALADDVAALVLISPTVARHDLSAVADRCVPKLVIYSDNDFSTPIDRTEAWLATMTSPIEARCFRGADHFFKGCESELAQCCQEFVLCALVSNRESACLA